MKVLFAGSSHFSILSLQALLKTSEVVAVLTRGDKPSGRKLVLTPTPVKLYALEKGIPVISPEVLNTQCREDIVTYNPDCMICVAYGKFFNEKFLRLFSKGSVNVHPSLLPRYRGASPLLATMLSDDTYTGVSIQKIVKEMDAGDIVLQSRRKLLSSYTYHTLSMALANDAAELITTLMSNYDYYYSHTTPQDTKDSVYTLKHNSKYGCIAWVESAQQIERMVRAFSEPLSGVKVYYNGMLLKLWKVSVVPNDVVLHKGNNFVNADGCQPGTVLGIHNDYGIIVSTVSSCIAIEELQLVNKKRMYWKDFMQGHSDFIGARLV